MTNKFIETIDRDGDPVIINLEAITHVEKISDQVSIYFQPDCLVVLKGKNADLVWRLLSDQSFQIYKSKADVSST